MDKYERLLRRMQVLTSYGYSADFHSWDNLIEYLETDEKLEEWYGKGWAEDYVLDELNAIDLIASAQ